MPDDELINHILGDLKDDIKDIKESVKTTCATVAEIKEKVIALDAVKANNERHQDSKLKVISIVIPSIISIIGIVAGKLTGFLK